MAPPPDSPGSRSLFFVPPAIQPTVEGSGLWPCADAACKNLLSVPELRVVLASFDFFFFAPLPPQLSRGNSDSSYIVMWTECY